MTDRFDPYDTLGVDKDADSAAIKAGYRRAAARAHPDNQQTGSREEWDRVERAYALLTDRKRRHLFDQTGHEAPNYADDLISAAACHLETTFFKVATEAIANHQNVEQLNIVLAITMQMQKEIAHEITVQDEAGKIIVEIKKMRARLHYKARGENLLDRVLENRQQLMGMNIGNSQRAVDVREKALELLKLYEYRFDDPFSGASARDRQAMQSMPSPYQYLGHQSWRP